MISFSSLVFPFLSKRVLVLAAVGVITAGRSVWATPFVIDLGHSHHVTSHVTAPFEGLNGTSVLGQTISLDLTWANGRFARIFTDTAFSFEAALTLQTNASGMLGFPEGSGFLVDANGAPIPGWGITGNASGDDGSMTWALFPLLKDEEGTPNTELERPFDFYGIHFDLTLPFADGSILVTGGQFGLFSDPGKVFGIGPGIPRDIVPDFGGTSLLLTIGGAVLLALRSRPRAFDRK